MKIANWDKNSYVLLDSAGGERLEQWGGRTLIRPDPQVLWRNDSPHALWDSADARYIRSDKGGGRWEYYRQLPEQWRITRGELTFIIKPTGFKHMGLFPEQAVNWDICSDLIRNAVTEKPVKILNLFAYTGGATLAAASAGASVCHVDAVKSVVDWAKENAAASGLRDKPIRWIVDDAGKFIEREIRRGNKYDGIILDPPSFGRGTNGELWKLEDSLYDMMLQISRLLSDAPLFVLLNSYTTGLSPSVMSYLFNMTLNRKADISAVEIGLTVERTGLPLPAGHSAYAVFKDYK